MQRLTQATKNLFAQIESALQLICSQQYAYKNPLMSNATIGQHVRHIIELYQEMLQGYRSGEVNYEKRQRNFLIETDIAFAAMQMNAINTMLNKADKQLLLTTGYETDNANTTIVTTYARELVYNIEHTIHHMALIRIAFKSAFNIDLNNEFGVAPSTLKYRKTCAQ
jgi:uncharacterized damage-inducible protein DinB